MIRIAIFDDNEFVLESFSVLMKHANGFTLTGMFRNCEALEEKITQSKPDVVVMDIDMPGTNGIEATRFIKSRFPEIQILIQTVFDDDDKIFNALCAGASGYILKEDLSDKIEKAISEVYEGGSPITPSVARKVISIFRNAMPVSAAPTESKYQLTQRETEVLALLVEGHSYKRISELMDIAYGTVHSHIKNIYRKLHVANNIEAVQKAIKEKLV